jgi:hypothetical protein
MTKPKVDAKEALDDIRGGMADTALMKKYRLSAKSLHGLIRKLVDADVLDQSEMEERAALCSVSRVNSLILSLSMNSRRCKVNFR